MKTRKKAILLWVITNPVIYRFFKDFANHRKKTNRAVVFSCRHSLTQGPRMRHSSKKEIPKSSRLEFSAKFLANNLASSVAKDNISGTLNRSGIANLPLLRTLLAIYQKSWEQKRENRYRDTRIIKIRVLRKNFNKQYCFIRCWRQHLWAVKWGGYRRFMLVENTISKSQEPSFWEVMDSLVLLAYVNLAFSRTLLQQ